MGFRVLKLIAFFAVLAVPLQFSGGVTTAYAGDDGCPGVVRGISNNYNFAKGTGFLAVRSGPGKNYAITGQLFNKNKVKVLGQSGSWFEVAFNGGAGYGWVFGKFLRVSC